jgi:hypothetical protein
MSKELDDLIVKLGSWDDQDDKQLDLFEINGQAAQPALTISAVSDTIDLSGLSYDISSMASGTSINNGYTLTTGTGAGQYTFTQPGQILSTGTNGLSWNDYGNVTPGALQVKGDAEFDGDVKIKGKSITEMFDKIEERLAILHPNPELEDRWEELKELGKRYRELEKDILEKEKMWDILKR